MTFVFGEENSSAPSGAHTGPSVNSKPPATRSSVASSAPSTSSGGPGRDGAVARVEVERRGAHPDVVARRGRDRAVDAEHRDLKALTRPRVPRQDDAVGSIEDAHDVAAACAQHEWQPAVHPYLRVVVDYDLEHDGPAGRVELAHALGHG